MATTPTTPEDRQPPSARPDPATAGATRDSLSENLLSQSAEDAEGDDTFSVAEEVNLDQQSGDVRRVGQAPEDPAAPGQTANAAPDATAASPGKPGARE